MATNVWETIAFPLLVESNEHFMDSDESLWIQQLKILDSTNENRVQRELKHLEDDGYLKLDRRGDSVASITAITPKAKRAVGAWPNTETVGQAAIDALLEQIENEQRPERKKVMQTALSALKDVGVSGAGQFVGAALKQAAGM